MWTRHDPEPMRELVDGLRHYAVPGVGLLPSVTTVLAATGGRAWGLERWRESLGAKAADAVTQIAADRGHALHWQIEAYLREGRAPAERSTWWRSVESTVEMFATCGRLLLCEGAVWDEEAQAAGTLDMTAELHDMLYLLDWTSAAEPKDRASLERKGVQLAGYADLCHTTYGRRPDVALIVVAIPEQPAQVRRVNLQTAGVEWRRRLAKYWA